LPKASLDTRSFEQLRDEAVALLPEAAPAWTDHNVSNTGMTLVELLAWLCEMDLYRVDRTTDEAVRAFLRLVGVAARPAQVAQAVLTVSSPAGLDLPAGLRLCRPEADGPVVFQTIEPVRVCASVLQRVVDGDEEDVTQRNAAGDAFAPFGEAPEAGCALVLGFDAPLGLPGAAVHLYVWGPDPAGDAVVRERLVAEYEAVEQERAQTCAVTLRDHPPWWLHHHARTVWEYFATDGRWHALGGVLDHTRALTLSGPVRFAVPADHAAGGLATDAALLCVRCRVVVAGYERTPLAASIAINAVAAAHAADATATLGTSRGHAQERWAVKPAPIVAGSTQLTVTIGAQQQTDWTEVPDWDLSGPHDRHYRLDSARNEIAFGDGRRGVVAGAGAQLALRLRVGGGTRGNLPARSLETWLDDTFNQALVPGWTALMPTLSLRQPFASFGGAPAESLKTAVARAIEETQTPSVLLTLQDFELAARQVPGVPVARTHAVADRWPSLPCYRASGDLAVIVVPDAAGPTPTPSAGLCAAVLRALERRRSPATRVHVLAPSWREVAVSATLHAAPGADGSRVQALAVAAVDRFFHPLQGGDGAGYPIGRAVYRSEVYALLARVPGVAGVSGLGLAYGDDERPRCDNLPLCDEELPAPGRHCIKVVAAPLLRIVDRSATHECP
jgi:predicted phage baseplate assembly protein